MGDIEYETLQFIGGPLDGKMLEVACQSHCLNVGLPESEPAGSDFIKYVRRRCEGAWCLVYVGEQA